MSEPRWYVESLRDDWSDEVEQESTALSFDDWCQDRAEAQHEASLGEPPRSAREDHLAAWQERREL